MADAAYRADIDGLRAVAVVSVVLFHGEIALPGGFLGVDVFFVISGYLICRLLLSELDRTGRISIESFYERRIRRIFPAMFVLCLLCLPFSFLWMFDGERSSFLESAIAALLFVSNFFFYQETGYFAAAAEHKPLLHFWSLAVEEQFYLVFPLFLVVAHRIAGRRSFFWAALIVCIGSAALMGWGAAYMRSAAFYLTPFRIWELMAGALMATANPDQLKAIPRALMEGGAIAAALLIAGAMTLYDPLQAKTAFPYMLAVVAGSTVLVAIGNGTLVGRLLALRPVVGIGLISYSTYLYHQPLFAFARLRSPEGLTLELAWALATLAFAFGWLSWRWIEQPFRGRASLVRKRVFLFAAMGTLALVAGLLAARLSALPSRFSQEVVALSDTLAAGTYGLSSVCQAEWATNAQCSSALAPRALLWGDSYAMHLAYGLEAVGVEFRQAALPSCTPSMKPNHSPNGRYEVECASFNAEVVAWLRREVIAGRVGAVILSSRDYGVRAGSIRRMPKEEEVDHEKIFAELKSTVVDLRSIGVRVGIVGPPPPATFDPGQCLLRVAAFGGEKERCRFRIHPEAEAQDRYLAELARSLDLPFLSLAQQICPNGQCVPIEKGVVLYRDNGHLTPQGSALLLSKPEAKSFLAELGASGEN